MSPQAKRCPYCLRRLQPGAAPAECPQCGRSLPQTHATRSSGRTEIARLVRGLLTRDCSECAAPSPIFARTCHGCRSTLRNTAWLPAIGTLAACVLGASALSPAPPARSPIAGLSDARFARCTELSAAWAAAIEAHGPMSRSSLAAQNAWHALCSRKALRDLPVATGAAMPASRRDWLALAARDQ